jgi:gas vesicle protein
MRGLFFAAAIGYVAGILYAPKSGCSLRKSIKDHFLTLQKEGLEVVQDVQRKGQELITASGPVVEQLKQEAGNLKYEGREIASDTKTSVQTSMQSAYERGKTAVDAAKENIAEKAQPVLSQLQSNVQELKERGAEFGKAVGTKST